MTQPELLDTVPASYFGYDGRIADGTRGTLFIYDSGPDYFAVTDGETVAVDLMDVILDD